MAPTCLSPAVVAACPPSDSTAACPHGGVTPIELSGLYLTSLFGSDGRKFWLGDCDITHNVSHDGTSAWVALVASSVRGERGGEVWRAECVDAHITLTYLRKEGAVPHTASDVAKRMRVQLQCERNNLHAKPQSTRITGAKIIRGPTSLCTPLCTQLVAPYCMLASVT